MVRGVSGYLKLGGQVVMWQICKKLGGQLPTLPIRHLRPWGYIGIKGHSVYLAIFSFVEFSTATFCVVSGNIKTGSKAADRTD
jgi:hypothetical protein